MHQLLRTLQGLFVRVSRSTVVASPREQVAMWLNHQKSFYDIQPDRDEVLLPWSFKGEVYKQYCTRVYFLLVWKEDVPGLKCRCFHRFMFCDTCANLNAKLLCRSITGHKTNVPGCQGSAQQERT